MTGSWVMDTLIICSIVLIMVPILVCLYKELGQKKLGGSNHE